MESMFSPSASVKFPDVLRDVVCTPRITTVFGWRSIRS
jgi:hypothetical protein